MVAREREREGERRERGERERGWQKCPCKQPWCPPTTFNQFIRRFVNDKTLHDQKRKSANSPFYLFPKFRERVLRIRATADRIPADATFESNCCVPSSDRSLDFFLELKKSDDTPQHSKKKIRSVIVTPWNSLSIRSRNLVQNRRSEKIWSETKAKRKRTTFVESRKVSQQKFFTSFHQYKWKPWAWF